MPEGEVRIEPPPISPPACRRARRSARVSGSFASCGGGVGFGIFGVEMHTVMLPGSSSRGDRSPHLCALRCRSGSMSAPRPRAASAVGPSVPRQRQTRARQKRKEATPRCWLARRRPACERCCRRTSTYADSAFSLPVGGHVRTPSGHRSRPSAFVSVPAPSRGSGRTRSRWRVSWWH